MVGSARRFATCCAAAFASMLLPTAALAAKPASPGGGKKPQPLWSGSYTYTNCYELDLAQAPDPGAIAGWEPAAPDAGAIVVPEEDDGDSPHAGSTGISTGSRINFGPVFEPLPPVLAGYQPAKDTSECSGTGTANRDNGALSAGSTWRAAEVAPTWEGAASAGAGVYKLVNVRDEITSLRVSSIFMPSVGGLQATKTGAGYADVLGSLFVRPLNCNPACPYQSDYILLARNNALGFAEVAPGDQTVVLTLRAPDGQKLPRGYYQVIQLVSTWSSNFRAPEQSSTATAAVTAKGFTLTTTP